MKVYAVMRATDGWDGGDSLDIALGTEELAEAYAERGDALYVEEVEVWDRLPEVTTLVLHQVTARVNPDGSLFDVVRAEGSMEHDERLPMPEMQSRVSAGLIAGVGGERKVPEIRVMGAVSEAEADDELQRLATFCVENWGRITPSWTPTVWPGPAPRFQPIRRTDRDNH